MANYPNKTLKEYYIRGLINFKYHNKIFGAGSTKPSLRQTPAALYRKKKKKKFVKTSFQLLRHKLNVDARYKKPQNFTW